jgi:hypothetical protein
MALGLIPSDYYRDLHKYILNWTFDNWGEVVKGLERLINDIKSGKIYGIRTGRIKPPCKPSIPWKTIDEALRHFFAIFVHDKERNIWKGGINKIVEGVTEYGFEVERDEALKIIVQSWKKKDDLRYDQLTKEQVAATLEVSVEEIVDIDC